MYSSLIYFHNSFALFASTQSDLPPPPPELIDDVEEPTRVSFGSSGPGVQSKTFRMLQDSIGNDQGDKIAISALLIPIFISVVVLIWAHARSTLNSINSVLPSFIHQSCINLFPMFYFFSS